MEVLIFFAAVIGGAFGSFLALVALAALRDNRENKESYNREQLIAATHIYHTNMKEDPLGFPPPDGSREEAEETMDYILGIIDRKSPLLKL